MPDKTKEQRLKEGINLLQQLRGLGVDDKISSFLEVQKVVSEWVTTGKAWDGRIEFPTYRRYAEISLPRSESRAATLNFKQKKYGY